MALPTLESTDEILPLPKRGLNMSKMSAACDIVPK